MRPDPAVRFWKGDTKAIGPSVTLVRLGGHFAGGTVLHWADWEQGRGALFLLSGDILQVVPSGHVSFMWSYQNLIPLPAATVQHIAKILEPFAFDVVYGSFSDRGRIDANGKQVVAASVARYIRGLAGLGLISASGPERRFVALQQFPSLSGESGLVENTWIGALMTQLRYWPLLPSAQPSFRYVLFCPEFLHARLAAHPRLGGSLC